MSADLTTPPILWALLFGIVGLLSVVTILSRLLTTGAAAAVGNPAVMDLRARVDGWWLMVGLGALGLVFGTVGVIVLFALLSFAALREYLSVMKFSRADHGALLLAFFVAVPVQYGLIAIGAYGLFSILIPVYGFVLLPIASVLRGETRGYLKRAAEAEWGLMLTVFCLSHAPALATLQIPGFEGRSLLLVLYLILVTQLSDVLQYAAGKLVGRRPIAPTISPGKTVEGTVLGIAGATGVGMLLYPLTPFTPVEAAGVSFVITVLGFLGGLVMSAIKRDLGVKDWSAAIPGHGGVLDRIDSVVFSAPVFFHLTRSGWL